MISRLILPSRKTLQQVFTRLFIHLNLVYSLIVLLKTMYLIGLNKRRYQSIIIILTLMIPFSSVIGQENVHRVSLEEAITLTIDNSHRLKAIEQEILSIKKIKKEAYKLRLPQFISSIIKSTTREKESPFSIPEQTNYIGRVELIQPLYRGGALKARYNQANVMLSFYNFAYHQEKERLKNRIEANFTNIYYAKKGVSFLEDMLKKAKETYNLVLKMYNLKEITKTEFLDAQVKLVRLEADYQFLNDVFNTSILELKEIIGLEPSIEIDIVIDEKFFELGIIPTTLNECILLAYQNRSEISILKMKTLTDEMDIIISKPNIQLDLIGEHKWRGRDFPLRDKDWIGGIRLTIPLVDCSISSSFDRQEVNSRVTTEINRLEIKLLDKILSGEKTKYENEKIDLYSKHTEMVELKERITREVRQAFYQLKAKETEIQISKIEISAKEENLKMIKKRYEIGEILKHEVIFSEMELIGAEANLAKAEYEYKIALNRLKEVIGK